MNGFVRERTILNNLKDPVLLAAFATPSKGGSTAASALSYLVQHWQAEPVLEFEAEHLYNYGRLRPQLITTEEGERQLQWPTNTVYLARPEGVAHSFLLLVGVEPAYGWQDFIRQIEALCMRAGVTTVVTLHSAPANVSHRRSTPVAAVYGSQELQQAFGLQPTVYHDGPMDFSAVLNLHLNAAGLATADLIALEPFYTPGLPDAQAAMALVRVIDRRFGTRTPMDSLAETAEGQRQLYEQIVDSSEHLKAFAERLDDEPRLLEQRESGDLSLDEVMEEVNQILSSS